MKTFTIFASVLAMGLAVFGFARQADSQTNPTPIAYWDFNQTESGVIVDKIGGYNMENKGGRLTDSGYDGSGHAIAFERTDTMDGMITAGSLPSMDQFTLSYRIALEVPQNVNGDRGLGYSSFGGFHASIYRNQILFIVGYGQSSTFHTDAWQKNEYHLLTYSHDGTTLKFYVDGVLKNSSPHSGKIESSRWSFGYADRTPFVADKIQFDEIKIYNVVLTDTQVLEEYSPGGKPSCTNNSWNCGEWGTCANGTQTRSCSKTSDCEGGTPMPSTSQSCTITPPTPSVPSCTASSWTCGAWNACAENNLQTRACTKNHVCQGGEPSPSASQSCVYTPSGPPACTFFNYSEWSSCPPEGIQTRKVISEYPAGCQGGKSPQITQSCSYVPPAPACSADVWTCDTWSECSVSGIESRNCMKTFDCPDAQTAPPATDQYCTPPQRQIPQAPPSESEEIANQDAILASTVKLICPTPQGGNYQGSGTVIDSSGIVLTNKHVVVGTDGCLVGFITNLDDQPYYGELGKEHRADILKTADNMDIALLKLRNPTNKKLTSIDITKGYKQLRLGTKITTYGYPGAFGLTVTVTSGDFSGRETSWGDYLKTSAIIEYGNSGGGAYLNDGTFLGIPTAGVKGELNTLGYILPVNLINSWMGDKETITFGPRQDNRFQRVSILDEITVKELPFLRLSIPKTDEKGNIIESAPEQEITTPKSAPLSANQNKPVQNAKPQLNQPIKESIVIESPTSLKDVVEKQKLAEQKREQKRNIAFKIRSFFQRILSWFKR